MPWKRTYCYPNNIDYNVHVCFSQGMKIRKIATNVYKLIGSLLKIFFRCETQVNFINFGLVSLVAIKQYGV